MFHARYVLLALALLTGAVAGADKVASGAKVFIAPMDGFETHLKTAFETKKVPLIVVDDRTQADYEITGVAASYKASTAKKVLQWDWRSTEEASIKMTNLRSGIVEFAYAVHKPSSAYGKRSTAEACAKHLKAFVTR